MKFLLIFSLLLAFQLPVLKAQPGTPTYKLNPRDWPAETIPLDKVIKEIRVIPLETKPGCFISYPGNILMTPDMIYTVNQSTYEVFCFDLKGKFIRKIGAIGKYAGLKIPIPMHTDGSWFISTTQGINWNEAISKMSESEKTRLRQVVPGFIEAEKVEIDGNPVVILYKF